MWLVSSLLALSALALTPTPKDLSVNEDDTFYLRGDTMVVLPDVFVNQRDTLLAPLAPALGGNPQVAPASRLDKVPKAVYLATVAHRGALEKRKLRRYYTDSDTLPPAGYRITVDKLGVVLVAADEAGLAYGVHALAGLVAEYGANLPYLDLRDWPTLAVRGVYLRHVPTPLEVEQLAALRTTHVFVESDDFYDLTGVRAETWQRAFDALRDARMEPIPVFSTLDGMEEILREYPMLIEGRAISEAIALNGVDARQLGYPNIIAASSDDIEVTISGVPCTMGEDYWLEGPAIQAPFHPDGPRWRIWRELEGKIPNGGTVTVRYSIATADSSSLAFADPQALRWLEERLAQVITVLEPRYLHLDHGHIGRFNTDIRSLTAGLSNPERFVQTVSVLETAVRAVDDGVSLMMWADLLNPAQAASTYGLEGVADRVPAGIQVLGRVQLETTAEAKARLNQLTGVIAMPAVIAAAGTPESIHALVQALEDGEGRDGGLVAYGESMDSATQLLAMAWSGTDRKNSWLRWLNDYFGVDLAEPDGAAVQSALVTYLNRQTLAGHSPEEVYAGYAEFLGRNRAFLEADETTAFLVRDRLRILTDYLDLEYDFSREGGDGTLRKLQRLVEQVQLMDGAAAEDRYQRILDTIANQGLFVPASILFQEDLRYYRPGGSELPLIEVPVLPGYEDAHGKVVCLLTLLDGQAPVRRIDFEGLGINQLTLDAHGVGGAFDTVARWEGNGKQAEVRGPVWIEPPVHAAELRLTATGERAPLVLRDVRVFGEKAPPAMDIHYAVQAPPMVPRFEGRSWAKVPQGHSFLLRDATPYFAEAPTSVWVTHTREALYFGIQARETRPDTIVADLTTRDAPLWKQESVELWFKRPEQAPIRLVVSPLGTQYDSEAYDGGWNGDWDAVAERNDQGWSAVVRVPMELLGSFRRGDSLEMNIVRHRMGVRSETSAWAHEYGAQPDLQWGMLRFP